MSEISPTAGASGAHGRVVINLPDLFRYDTPILLRTTEAVPLALAEKWADNTIAQIDDKFIPGWAAVLDSLDSYQTLMVEPATTGYPDFLAPGRISRRGHSTALSLTLHANRLALAYDKLVAAIDFLTDAGRDAFEAKLLASKDAYREGAALPLSLTGDYLEQLLGAAVRQWFFLNSDPRLPLYQWPIDVLNKSFPPDVPFLIAGNQWNNARKHNNLLIQGGCFALQVIPFAKVHDYLDELLTGALRDDYYLPPRSSIRFVTIDGVLNIRTSIEKKPTI